MIRILIWREQIARVGDLDPATRATIATFGNEHIDTPKSSLKSIVGHRLRPGTMLVREHAGTLHRVMVLANGFAWNGGTYGSLSQVALAITGTHWNGRRFFGVDKDGATSKSSRAARERPT